MAANKNKTLARRYGIAEIYGHDFARLSAEELRKLALVKHSTQPCPFRGGQCNKKHGVCTLRTYERGENGEVKATTEPIVTVCPSRFQQQGTIRRLIGETLLDTPTPREIKEIPFLKGPAADDSDDGKPVGRIDTIFVHPDAIPFKWCPAEIQAVYFSGKGMNSQFQKFAAWEGPDIPFPDETRRPDFRSSGPKRLMPQLQVKIPTLRRWGKKMAIVTDRAFFEKMGRMVEVNDISNCDIVWFEVDYEMGSSGFILIPYKAHWLTLERAIEGLVAGEPMRLQDFEGRIKEKLGVVTASTNSDHAQ